MVYDDLMINKHTVVDYMQINPDKFQYIVFGKHVNVSNLIIGNNVIIPETNVKILGLHLDKQIKLS